MTQARRPTDVYHIELFECGMWLGIGLAYDTDAAAVEAAKARRERYGAHVEVRVVHARTTYEVLPIQAP